MAKISVVCWNFTKKFNIEIENGDQIIVNGYIDYYPKFGNVQINVISFEQLGKGDLHKEYIKLKEYYNNKGYFNDDSKRSLPKHIKNIGIITAKDGQALKDFLYILNKNSYHGKVYIKGSYVQGINCPKSINESLLELDSMKLDVIIITRGGGSYEDLFGFSSKEVIEGLYNTNTCTISAIGHEGDFMLSDFVADIRAPTPSLAGELITEHQNKINNMESANNYLNTLQLDIIKHIQLMRKDLDNIDIFIKDSIDIMKGYSDSINSTIDSSKTILGRSLLDSRLKINNIENAYNIINPLLILNKGYTLLQINNKGVNTVDDIGSNRTEKLKLKMMNGYVTFNISNLRVVRNEN
jgi:exodeoxyribonuclease VII large subunit